MSAVTRVCHGGCRGPSCRRAGSGSSSAHPAPPQSGARRAAGGAIRPNGCATGRQLCIFRHLTRAPTAPGPPARYALRLPTARRLHLAVDGEVTDAEPSRPDRLRDLLVLRIALAQRLRRAGRVGSAHWSAVRTPPPLCPRGVLPHPTGATWTR